MSQDPVSIDELQHDIDSASRRAEQDQLEAEFRRDPDWDLVAEHLIKRETIGDLLEMVYRGGPNPHLWDEVTRAVYIIRLAIEQCAHEYAERNATI